MATVVDTSAVTASLALDLFHPFLDRLAQDAARIPDSVLREVERTSAQRATTLRQLAGIEIVRVGNVQASQLRNQRQRLRRRLKKWRGLSDTDLDCLGLIERGDDLWTCEAPMSGAASLLGGRVRDMLDLVDPIEASGALVADVVSRLESRWNVTGSATARPLDWQRGDTVAAALTRRRNANS